MLREREKVMVNPSMVLARPGERPRSTDRCGAIADALGAREQGPRGHEMEREKHRKKEGEKATLTTARSGAKVARNVE